MLLYQTAFGYYDLGYASAMVVVFFVLILLISLRAAAHPAVEHGNDDAAAEATGDEPAATLAADCARSSCRPALADRSGCTSR